MLLAVWGRSGTPLLSACLAEFEACTGAGVARCDVGQGSLLAATPSRIRRTGDLAVGWLYPGSPYLDAEFSPGPDIRLTDSRLAITVGPLPQQPLYYARADGDSLVVACSLLGPLARIVASKQLNISRLVSWATWQRDVDAGATVYRHIRRVRPCERIIVDANGIRSEQQMPSAEREELRGSPDALAEELLTRLRNSVGRAIGSARRVAVLASGGLDSAGVAALAAQHCHTTRQLEIISLVGATPGDDRPHLAELEKHLGLKVVRHPAREAARHFPTSLCIDHQPVVHGGACLNLHLLSTAAEREAEVTLSGASGDHVCGGTIDFAPLVRRGRPLDATLRALRICVPTRVSPVRRLGHWIAFPLVRPLLPPQLVTCARRRRLLAPWMRRPFRELLDACLDTASATPPRTPDERLREHCMSYAFADLATVWGQIASVTRSVAVDVFRDLELVRFTCAIDPTLLSHGGTYRGLYRLCMKGLIPDSVRTRADKALGQPLLAEAVLASGGFDLLTDLSALRGLAEMGLVEPSRFEPVFNRWLRAVRRGERTTTDPMDGSWQSIWQLLTVEAFVRHHLSAS